MHVYKKCTKSSLVVRLRSREDSYMYKLYLYAQYFCSLLVLYYRNLYSQIIFKNYKVN